MQRTIKFRAWNKSKGQMVPDYAHFDKQGKLVTVLTYPEDEYELMQYTGLQDKNGVEIYEGDIIKLKQNTIWQVAYNEEKVKWHMWAIDPTNSINITKKATHNDKYEVIGNVFENPELLTNE